MKKSYLTSLILIGLMPLITHCASQQDVQYLDYNVRSINKKLDDMKINTVDQMQQRQAMSSGQLDQLQADILQLKSKLEEFSHMNRMLQEQNKELQLAVQNLSSQQEVKFNSRIAELDSKIATQKESLTAIQMARVQDAERRSKAAKKAANDAMRKARQASLAKNPTRSNGVLHLSATSKKVLFPTTKNANTITVNPIATSQTATKPTTAVVSKTADSFGNAQQKYSDGNYQEAFTLFEKIVSKKGSNKTAITSRYMMGECLFQQGKYDQAIIQYQQIISSYPGNPQAATALLRQGEAFEQLSDNETARIIYKKISASYASSPEAVTAKKRISNL